MAMIPGCDYDIFISYAHADNPRVDGDEGWVDHFVARLRETLGMRLGAAKKLSIFCDSNVVEANSRLNDLLAAVHSSAIFLAIGSPSYISQDWTVRELAAFVEKNKDLDRLFLVELLPLNHGDHYPSPLDGNIHFDFWKEMGPRGIRMPLTINSDQEQFYTRIHTLAADLANKLISLRLLPSPAKSLISERPAAAAPNGHASSSCKTVVLAQTTEDVDDELDQLRTFLLQYSDEIRVLPEVDYPQGGDEFKAAFQNDVAQADMVVQLLGKRAGRTPRDLPQGYTIVQCDLARSTPATFLQWRRPDIDPEACTDPTYKAILKSETVISSGLETFKLQLLKEARKKVEARRAYNYSTVFINADKPDLEVAREVERECLKNALPAILPMSGASSEIVRKDLAENLVDCDVLLFLYGDSTEDWIRDQLRLFNKMRPRREFPPKLMAICSGPPPKPDIGMRYPEGQVQKIDCPEGWDIGRISKLIMELAG
jgi:hypothetical protein